MPLCLIYSTNWKLWKEVAHEHNLPKLSGSFLLSCLVSSCTVYLANPQSNWRSNFDINLNYSSLFWFPRLLGSMQNINLPLQGLNHFVPSHFPNFIWSFISCPLNALATLTYFTFPYATWLLHVLFLLLGMLFPTTPSLFSFWAW